jgi:5-methylcytosine-specific restriction endonuclease McrA
MAERRMFAKTIIDSDAFLDMPLSTQALYFHLSMRADDEGFINNPKKIQRMIGATEDDMKLLVAKNFIIPFESGVVVIKHWRIHNYIRADRLVETKYKEERELLEIKENGAYTISEELKEIEKLDANDIRKIAYKNSSLPYSFNYKITRAFEGRKCPICNREMMSSYKNCMPTVQHNLPLSKGGVHELENISVICEHCNTSIKDKETDKLNNKDVINIWDKIVLFEANKIKWFEKPSILWQTLDGQVTDSCLPDGSIGKDRIGKDSIDKVSIDKDKIVNFQKVADLYNDTCVSFPRLTTMSESRKKAIRARLKVYSMEDLERLFKKAEASSFLKGQNDRNWSATFDWLIKDSNMVKVLDGNYDDKKPTQKSSSKAGGLDEFYQNVAEWVGDES